MHHDQALKIEDRKEQIHRSAKKSSGVFEPVPPAFASGSTVSG
jgi:hypothetical protein